MNKAELVDKMAKLTNLPKSTCKECLEGFMAVVGGALKKDDTVVLTGFGTFKVVKRQSRTGVNPVTRAPMKIPAKRVPTFRPGKALKDSI